MARTPLTSLPTPALLLDLDIMERNLSVMSDFFRAERVGLRPHFKNHRVLALAERQIESGAIGITCARLWQAEALAAHGVRNILLANEVAGGSALRQLAELTRRAELIAAVDNARVVTDMARLARSSKVPFHVVVDVDLGLKRCGVEAGEPALALARLAVASGLRFRGLMGYEGHLQPILPGPEKDAAVLRAIDLLARSKALIERAGIPVEIISCGGTGDYRIVGRHPLVTEHQAGAYLLMDRWYAPFAPDFSPALSVLATVISKTAGKRIVVDAGVKAISGERGLCSIKSQPGLRVTALHAEHALIDILTPNIEIDVGDKLELDVQYHDGTVNLYRKMHGIRHGEVEQTLDIVH